jgi:hypothetical protein
METNPIIEKVQAILDRANHPNTPQAEAETALAMAQKLMLKHGLDEAVLAKARKTDEVIVRETLDITGTWGLNRARLFYVIAQQVNVACYRSVVSKKLVVMTMYGTASDIFTAKTLFASAEMLATRLIPRGNRSFRHSWWLGFISGVSEVLRKSKREFIAEQGTGTELVLADKFKRADSEMRSRVKLKTCSTSYSSGNGYGAGQSAGRSFTSGTGVGGRAIGALSR